MTSLRNQLALMYRGDRKDLLDLPTNIIVQAEFDSLGVFNIAVCDPETKAVMATFNSPSLKEVIQFIERF